jgi:hypothetical protein
VFSVTSALEILKLKPAFFPELFLVAFPTVIYPFHRYSACNAFHIRVGRREQNYNYFLTLYVTHYFF